MTQIGRILCAFCGGLFGYSITYAWCKFWDFIGRKRVEIPEIKYDVTDNPILQLKNRLGQAYVASYDRTAKKLLHRLLEYVEWIDNWHKEQVLLVENDRNGYKRKAERLQTEFEAECSKNAELEKQLKEEREKNKIPLFSDQTEVPSYLISENTFGNQLNPFAKIILNTKPGEPIPVGYSGTAKTATEATELAERLQNMTSQPIVMDSETLNETQTKNEEFIKQLRDWWGLEASKAVELPNSIKKYVSADQLRQEYAWILALYKNPNNVPLRRFKVRVAGTYNDGKDSLLTDWILPATSINEIRNVLGEDGIRVLGGEELPI